ncbi:type II and III secretion system protein family protein [Thiohalobacter sp.]|uniref:type II and III secretion system protein family protein n=1 Tax=Thiohalobacter sp. TaxID=2025948 RepID=UPI002638EBDE|nr:pilus assembly protein N-terminal domain-containing protein [Thiohalobacter sp.]
MKNTINRSLLGILLVLFMAWALQAQADSLLRLYVGDMQVLPLGEIKRVAVGNGGVLSTSILEDGQLLVLAEKEGETEMRVWLTDGSERVYKISIAKQDTLQASSEARSALRNLPGVTLRRVGNNIVVEGKVDGDGKALIEKINATYKLIDLTVQNDRIPLKEILANIPGIQVREVGKFSVVEGQADEPTAKLIESVIKNFPNVVNLVRTDLVKPERMVYMKVQITEFNTSRLENLGIAWETSFPGPAAGVAVDFTRKGDLSALAGSVLSGVTSQTAATSAIGYFGLATQISSTINLAISNGDALLLASPTLSAASGGKAEFLSGGEVPVPVPGPDLTTTIEYKQFGIILNIEPTADDKGNVRAKVETEVSSIDQSTAVDNTPGFRTRRTSAEVSLKQGQTLVISGLVNREVAEDVSKLAGLGDLPILGALFRSSNFRNGHSDLVIFITPYVYDADSPVNRAQLERADQLRARFLKNIEKNGDILD